MSFIFNTAFGQKFDAGKPRASLIPPGFTKLLIDVLEYGAAKYGENNWKNVADAHQRYYDALMRHVAAWWGGELCDEETGLHHLMHGACCIAFLVWLDLNAKTEK